jgi:hypothetical protein
VKTANASAIRFNFLASDYGFQALIYGMNLSGHAAALAPERTPLPPYIATDRFRGLGRRDSEHQRQLLLGGSDDAWPSLNS